MPKTMSLFYSEFLATFSGCFTVHFYSIGMGSKLTAYNNYRNAIDSDAKLDGNSPLTRSTSMRSGLIWPVFLGLLPKPCSKRNRVSKESVIAYILHNIQ